jgi:Cys-tRNA(Pro)/Cys-tRNA(Cys) deacylase
MSKKTNALRILEQHKIPYDLIEYTYDAENLNVAKIAEDNGLALAQVYKTLVAKGDKTGIIVAVIAGDKSLSLKKIATVSGNKKIALVPVKDIQGISGYIRGGCSPLGMKKQFPTYFDQSAKNFDKIYVNAGVRGVLFGCAAEYLLPIAAGQWADIAED